MGSSSVLLSSARVPDVQLNALTPWADDAVMAEATARELALLDGQLTARLRLHRRPCRPTDFATLQGEAGPLRRLAPRVPPAVDDAVAQDHASSSGVDAPLPRAAVPNRAATYLEAIGRRVHTEVVRRVILQHHRVSRPPQPIRVNVCLF